MFNFRRIQYNIPQVPPGDEFRVEYATELAMGRSLAMQRFESVFDKKSGAKFDTRPSTDEFPYEIGNDEVFNTTPLLQSFGLYYHNKLRILFFHFEGSNIMSLAGADMNLWLHKLGRDYTHIMYRFPALRDELQTLDLSYEGPQVSVRAVNTSRAIMGSEQLPVHGLPLFEGTSCNRCGYSAKHAREVTRHFRENRNSNGHRNSGYFDPISKSCLRQTPNPLRGNGLSRRYVVCAAPDDFFLQGHQHSRTPNQTTDFIKKFATFDPSSMKSILEDYAVISGAKIINSLNTIVSNGILSQGIFSSQAEMDLSLLTPMDEGNQHGAFTSVRSYGGIGQYCAVAAQICFTDMKQILLFSPGFVQDGIDVPIPEGRMSVTTDELSELLNTIYRTLSANVNGYDKITEHQYNILCGSASASPALYRETTNQVQTITRDQKDIYTKILRYLYKTLTCPLRVNASVRAQAQQDLNQPAVAIGDDEDIDMDDDEDAEEIEAAGGIGDLPKFGFVAAQNLADILEDDMLERQEGQEHFFVQPEEQHPLMNRFATTRTIFKLTEEKSASSMVSFTTIAMAIIKFWCLELLYGTLVRDNINQGAVAQQFAMHYKKVISNVEMSAFGLLRSIKAKAKVIDRQVLSNRGPVVYNPERNLVKLYTGKIITLNDVGNTIAELQNEMFELLLTDLLFVENEDELLNAVAENYTEREDVILNTCSVVVDADYVDSLTQHIFEWLNIFETDDLLVLEEQLDKLESWLRKHQLIVKKLVLFLILTNNHLRSTTLAAITIEDVFIDTMHECLYCLSKRLKSQKLLNPVNSAIIFVDRINFGILFLKILPVIYREVHKSWYRKMQVAYPNTRIQRGLDLHGDFIFSTGLQNQYSNHTLLLLTKEEIASQFGDEVNYRLMRRILISLQHKFTEAYHAPSGITIQNNSARTTSRTYVRLIHINVSIASDIYRYYLKNHQSWISNVLNDNAEPQVEAAEGEDGGGDNDLGDDGDESPRDDYNDLGDDGDEEPRDHYNDLGDDGDEAPTDDDNDLGADDSSDGGPNGDEDNGENRLSENRLSLIGGDTEVNLDPEGDHWPDIALPYEHNWLVRKDSTHLPSPASSVLDLTVKKKKNFYSNGLDALLSRRSNRLRQAAKRKPKSEMQKILASIRLFRSDSSYEN